MPARKPALTPEEIAAAFTGPGADAVPPILTPSQLAKLLQLSIKTIYEWLAKGRLDGTYRKRGKHVLLWRDRAIAAIFNGKDWMT